MAGLYRGGEDQAPPPNEIHVTDTGTMKPTMSVDLHQEHKLSIISP